MLSKNAIKSIKALGIATIVIIIMASCCTTIDSASVGIRFKKWSSNEQLRGGVEGTCRGWVWYNPITESIFEYPTFIQRVTYDPFTVNPKDAAIFSMTPTLAYQIDEAKATDIFIKYRKPVKELELGYIKTCIFEAYRTCANNYTSDELMANRAKFESEVRARLDESMNQEGFIVREFTTKIDPPASLTEAINAKNEAVQNALKAENKVKEAEAEAKIEIAKAEGEARALKIKGDGEAYYNRVVSASLNGLIVQQYAIEKWNGELPTYNGGGALPFIGLDKK
ncbi:MAG: prohibitin family protein [Bacteroidales bacterium]|nr:prohibitin family protein [Bacteroidales bacterium]